jgi:hypothetical protein
VFWILWWLVWIWIAFQGIEDPAAHPFSLIQGLVVAVIFGQFPALLVALVWDREPAKLMDLISRQLPLGTGACLATRIQCDNRQPLTGYLFGRLCGQETLVPVTRRFGGIRGSVHPGGLSARFGPPPAAAPRGWPLGVRWSSP